jgi:hypothetical protein
MAAKVRNVGGLSKELLVFSDFLIGGCRFFDGWLCSAPPILGGWGPGFCGLGGLKRILVALRPLV